VTKISTEFHSAKLNNARLSYSDLNIKKLGAVRHLGFLGRWISTIVRPPMTNRETALNFSKFH